MWSIRSGVDAKSSKMPIFSFFECQYLYEYTTTLAPNKIPGTIQQCLYLVRRFCVLKAL